MDSLFLTDLYDDTAIPKAVGKVYDGGIKVLVSLRVHHSMIYKGLTQKRYEPLSIGPSLNAGWGHNHTVFLGKTPFSHCAAL